MSHCPDCEAVCLANATVLLDNGDVIPVVGWFDSDGDDAEPNEAVACYAGPDRDGFWYSIDLSKFESGATH